MKRKGLYLVLFIILALICLFVLATESSSQHYRFLQFSGYRWLVRSCEKPAGPGPNYFSVKNVRVDEDGLKLAIRERDGIWSSSQVNLIKTLGYGTYVFVTGGNVQAFDPNIVLGLFTWDNSANKYHNRELDIEFSRWGNQTGPNAQFIVQPGHYKNVCGKNCSHFTIGGAEQFLTNFIYWRPGVAEFRTYYGKHGAFAPDTKLIHKWRKTGNDVPEPGQERIQINFWLFRGNPPLNGQNAEIVINNFLFKP